jgi:hypothetical protein
VPSFAVRQPRRFRYHYFYREVLLRSYFFVRVSFHSIYAPYGPFLVLTLDDRNQMSLDSYRRKSQEKLLPTSPTSADLYTSSGTVASLDFFSTSTTNGPPLSELRVHSLDRQRPRRSPPRKRSREKQKTNTSALKHHYHFRISGEKKRHTRRTFLGWDSRTVE